MLQSFVTRRILSPLNNFVYRISRGRLMGKMSGLPVLLLTTTGRRSGKRRTAPLLYLEDDGAYIVIASFGGQPSHPAWYLNLEANPAASVEIGETVTQVRAQTVHGDDRARLWEAVVQGYAGYDAYQRKTEREIPLVALRPV